MAEILVLEDDPEARELSEQMLESKTDAETETAPGVDEIDDFNYEVVVVDYDGINVEEASERADNPVIFTGFSEADIEVPEDAEYVQKGGGYDELSHTVKKYLT